MSDASVRTGAADAPWDERLQPWFAATFSALLHVLLFFLLLYAAKPTFTPPQGAASGGRVKVDFIGQPRQTVRVQPNPSIPKAARPPRAASPVLSKPVEHARNPLPPELAAAPDARPDPAPSVPPPEPSRDDDTQRQASQPEPAQRRPETWTGRPPGTLEQERAPDDDGFALTTALNRGNRNDIDASTPSMELGGYMVYYDTRSERRLRSWMAAGMKEIFLPLPGTRQLMVCQAQVALVRGSGKCRLLAPDSPELKDIGDARDAINVIQVYRRGEMVWRGPGPYR